MRNGAWAVQLPIFHILMGLLLLSPVHFSAAQDCCSVDPAGYSGMALSLLDPRLEQELLLLTNRHRTGNGLPELVLDESLAEIARNHATGMAHQGFISHSLPGGNLKSRMSRAGYLFESARENVAAAPTVLIARDALIQSPDHEKNILANDVTRVGIGIARCPDPSSSQLYITQIFAAPRGSYQPEKVQEMLLARVEDLRQNGAGSMLVDRDLEEIASRSLRSLSIPYRQEELQDALSASARELDGSEFSGLQANVQLVHNPRNLRVPNRAPEGRARSFGSAVRQVTDAENQAAFLVLTLIGVAR